MSHKRELGRGIAGFLGATATALFSWGLVTVDGYALLIGVLLLLAATVMIVATTRKRPEWGISLLFLSLFGFGAWIAGGVVHSNLLDLTSLSLFFMCILTLWVSAMSYERMTSNA